MSVPNHVAFILLKRPCDYWSDEIIQQLKSVAPTDDQTNSILLGLAGVNKDINHLLDVFLWLECEPVKSLLARIVDSGSTLDFVMIKIPTDSVIASLKSCTSDNMTTLLGKVE